MKRMNQNALSRAFHEIEANPPAVLEQTRRKKGAAAADRQRVAIAIAKSRKAGRK